MTSLFKSKTDKEKSAREISKEITKEKRQPEHLGKHTFQTLRMEIFSLRNTKPAFRDSKWKKRAEGIESEIAKQLNSKNQARLKPLINILGDTIKGGF